MTSKNYSGMEVTCDCPRCGLEDGVICYVDHDRGTRWDYYGATPEGWSVQVTECAEGCGTSAAPWSADEDAALQNEAVNSAEDLADDSDDYPDPEPEDDA